MFMFMMPQSLVDKTTGIVPLLNFDAIDDGNIVGGDWSNPGNAVTNDDIYATHSLPGSTSNYQTDRLRALRISGFGLPTNAINIKPHVRVRAKVSGVGNPDVGSPANFRGWKNGLVGFSNGPDVNPGVLTTTEQLWEVTNLGIVGGWSPTDWSQVTDTGFDFNILNSTTQSVNPLTAQVDRMDVEINYQVLL